MVLSIAEAKGKLPPSQSHVAPNPDWNQPDRDEYWYVSMSKKQPLRRNRSRDFETRRSTTDDPISSAPDAEVDPYESSRPDPGTVDPAQIDGSIQTASMPEDPGSRPDGTDRAERVRERLKHVTDYLSEIEASLDENE